MTSKAPATPDYLARRLARIRWPTGVPAAAPSPRSRLHLVATCRAELEWATERWRAEARDVDEWACRFGPHPSEAGRLPHEMAAAALVNAHLHVDVENARLRDLGLTLRAQREAALDHTQDAAYRACWAEQAEASLGEYRRHRLRRQLAWRCFRAAADRYQRLRAFLESGDSLAA